MSTRSSITKHLTLVPVQTKFLFLLLIFVDLFGCRKDTVMTINSRPDLFAISGHTLLFFIYNYITRVNNGFGCVYLYNDINYTYVGWNANHRYSCTNILLKYGYIIIDSFGVTFRYRREYLNKWG